MLGRRVDGLENKREELNFHLIFLFRQNPYTQKGLLPLTREVLQRNYVRVYARKILYTVEKKTCSEYCTEIV